MNYRFYMVWVEGKPAPTKKYYIKDEAVEEAKRLAAKEMKVAYVMQSDERYQPSIRIDTDFLYKDAPEGYTDEPCSE